MQKCNRCKITKDLDAYFKAHNRPNGRATICKTCRSEEVHKQRLNNYFVHYVRGKKSECKTRGVIFDLDAAYIENLWTGVCPIFGNKIEYGLKGRGSDHTKSAHLDRIDPDKGYVYGNVTWICGRANRIKYNASISEMEQIINYMRQAKCND